ncbi:Hpt domain-containing response regulator [Skermania piniformis]|uniref:Hpt domain-containing response regulator n=1 Tax=Skermania pinensis TaxID=39122 RepID=UPI003CCE80C6
MRSTVGVGSTFEFTADLRLPAASAEPIAVRPPQLVGKRVLVTDDSEAAREILVPILRGFGMDVAAADSGYAALRLLNDADRHRQPYDLVLMDWQMPGMDGLAAAQIIRETPSLNRIPAVLMVTAYCREEVLNRADQLGLQGVLVKPVTHSMMFDTLAGVLAPAAAGAARPADTEPGLPARQAFPTLAGRRALVVDDNIFNREVAAGFLAEVGVESDCAVDGNDALGWLDRGGRYDVVLMDVQMPVMDGYETSREVRNRPEWADIPIIALTAHARAEDRQRSADAGMDGHLTKPIDEQALYTMLTDMLRGAAAVRTPGDPSVAPAPNIGSDPARGGDDRHVDLVAALERLGGRQELLARLVDSFVQDFGSTPDRMVEQYALGHAAEVAGFAHAVRGAASYLHADALCAIASELEDTVRRSGLETTGALVDGFVAHLKLVLDELGDGRAEPPAAPPVASAPAVDTTELLRLVDSADQLIGTGDYSAQSILSEIESRTSGTHLASSATRIRQLFDQLELDEAQLALRSFRAAAGARSGSTA